MSGRALLRYAGQLRQHQAVFLGQPLRFGAVDQFVKAVERVAYSMESEAALLDAPVSHADVLMDATLTALEPQLHSVNARHHAEGS